MSVLGRQISGTTVAVLVLVIVAFGGLLPVWSSSPSREIVLVARDMAFYVEGGTGAPNPILEVKAGETVRLVLRNQDRGMTHDFAVPVIRTSTKLLAWGDQQVLTFDAPATPGIYEYVCSPHSLMMKGTFLVR